MANKKIAAAQPFDVSKYQTKGQTTEMEVTINEDTSILYTSCINYVRGSLFTELSPKYTTMFDNMNGNLKFNYIGTGTNLKNLFNSYDLEYEE